MTKIALLGAGGKMGVRLAQNLQKGDFVLLPVEVTEEGRKRLKDETGLDCIEQAEALAELARAAAQLKMIQKLRKIKG